MLRRSAMALATWISVSAAAGVQAAPSTPACLECHGVEGRRPAGTAPDGVSLFLGDWERSVHTGLECADCHAGIASLPHDTPTPAARCDACHEAESTAYASSTHGLRAAEGDAQAPRCAMCHDPHAVLSSTDPQSPLHRSRVAQVCTNCHADNGRVSPAPTAVPHPATSYLRGAHARAVGQGNLAAATCGDCHDSHAVLRAQDPSSPIFRRNIPHTCGACHAVEFEAFAASVHGQAVERGSSGSPVCNTCHGEHAVVRLGEVGATAVVASETCESCHSNPALVRRFDLPASAVTSYEDSYHGRAARGGLAQAAGCTSCHGVHRILAQSDSASSIHPANLVQTCRACHPAATESFATSYAHTPRRDATVEGRGVNIVRGVYVWLIAVVIGGMLLHNAVVAAHDIRARWRRHRLRATHVRFLRGEVRQHGVLLVSFSLLAISGFALRYPEMSWARALSDLGLDEEARRLVHRVSAVAMLVVSLYHAVYLFTRRGREQLGHMRPQIRDFGDLRDNMLFNLGRRLRRPDFTRFRYIEKAEYWALVWGTVIMALTGFMLWFPERLTGASWHVRVAEAVHFYEAWLAFLAILVWHLFYVLLRPGITGSFTALTGRMDPEELAHEHPAEFARHYGTTRPGDNLEAADGATAGNDVKSGFGRRGFGSGHAGKPGTPDAASNPRAGTGNTPKEPRVDRDESQPHPGDGSHGDDE